MMKLLERFEFFDPFNLGILLLVFLFASCQLENPLTNVNPDEVITLVPINDSGHEDSSLNHIPADSVSWRIIKIVIGSKADPAQPISVRTSHGVLTNVGEPMSSNSGQTLTITPVVREVLVQLNALNVYSDKVIVSASVGTVSNFIPFVFEPAYPSEILLSPLALSPLATSTVDIVVKAFSASGKVSENIQFDVEIERTSVNPTILLDYPEKISLHNQGATFRITNINQKTESVTVNVTAPDKTTKHLQFTYQ